MVYIIEISFIAKKVASVECVLSELTKLGDRYNCIEKYHICESKSKKYTICTKCDKSTQYVYINLSPTGTFRLSKYAFSYFLSDKAFIS